LDPPSPNMLVEASDILCHGNDGAVEVVALARGDLVGPNGLSKVEDCAVDVVGAKVGACGLKPEKGFRCSG
jgi:hypothetical protein